MWPGWLILTALLPQSSAGERRLAGASDQRAHETVYPLLMDSPSDSHHHVRTLTFKIVAFNQTFLLNLRHTDSFLPSHFHVQTLVTGVSNSTLRVHPAHERRCLYSGSLLGDSHSRVSVSVCEGLMGFLHTSHGDYVIQPNNKPSPTRHKNPGVNISSVPHTLHLLGDGHLSGSHHALHGRQCGVTASNSNRRLHRLRYHGNAFPYTSGDFPKRIKRSESKEWNIEVMVVADSKMLQYHGDNLRLYVLTLMAAVALIYKDPSIGNAINIAVVRFIIMDEAQDRDIIFPSASKTLRNFCRWQQQHNDFDDNHHPHHDTAILLTREDLCRLPKTCDTLGLAQSGMACDRQSSCAIVEDNGLSAAFTIAHELGHVLGIPHDDDRKCQRFIDQGQRLHVMARMLDYNSHPWSWSACSRHYLTNFLDGGYGNCLLDKPKVEILSKSEHTSQPPGQLYDMDYQCELVFGRGSKICPYMPVCKRLWCTIEDVSQGGCRTQHMPWADGTMCDIKKWCRHGECAPMAVSAAQPVEGEWGRWESFGQCSRTCGGGVKQSIRECDSPRPANGGRYCTGIRVRYRSCNTQDCPSSSQSFREEQCSAFNGQTLNFPGLEQNVKWVPHYLGINPSDVCKLYCRAVGTAAHFLLKEKVIDGTPCDMDRYDICINGECKVAGCDHKLESKKKPDRCGVCGGDNSTCKLITGTFNDIEYGYNDIVMIPAGASNVDIQQMGYLNAKDDNYLALKDSDHRHLLNGGFMISMFPKTLHYGGSVLEYSGSDSVVERINGTKQLNKNLYVQVLTVGNLRPPRVHFWYTVSLADQDQHQWEVEKEWSPCSRVCRGEQFRRAVCKHVSDNRTVSDGHCHEKNRPADMAKTCNLGCALRWRVTETSECSASCGTGVQYHVITCMQEMENSDTYKMPDEICEHLEDKPPSKVDCKGPCAEVHWEFGHWSECSQSCGSGKQIRSAKCVNELQEEQPEDRCDSGEMLTTQSCSKGHCPQWNTTDWSECSVSCGQGESKRLVNCYLPDGAVVSAVKCNLNARPEDTKECHLAPCPVITTTFVPEGVKSNLVPALPLPLRNMDHLSHGVWSAGLWSECSVSCGEGSRHRQVVCINRYDGSSLPESSCAKHRQPVSMEICQTSHCGQWRTGEWSQCPVTCGEGVSSRFVVCVLPGDKQTDDKACDQLTRPVRERLCNADMCERLPGSFPLQTILHNSVEGLYYWRTGLWGQCSKTCGGGLQRRQVACYDEEGQLSSQCNPNEKPTEVSDCNTQLCAEWSVGNWTECSAKCGPAVQTRQVQCWSEKEEVPSEHCTNVAPESERKCSLPACPEWTWSEWTECPEKCVNATQVRHPECYQGETKSDDVVCIEFKKPNNQTRACIARHCSYRWNKKRWSQCSATCGKGHKQREVYCVDGGNDAVPDHFCSPPLKPRSLRRCRQTPCPLTWRSTSWSECSQSCGQGLQTRKTTCHRVNPYGWIDLEPLPVPQESAAPWCNVSERPPDKKVCSKGHCENGGTIWRPGPWLQCSESCGKGRQRRRVHCFNLRGNRVPNRKCDKSLRPRRRRRCMLRPCPPISCLDIRQRSKIYEDGEHELYVRGRYARIYCSGMNTTTPKEYISLISGESDNYSEFYNKRLLRAYTCPLGGARLDACPCVRDRKFGAGLTTFARIAINITSLRVFTHDYTYSQTHHGEPEAYGESGDCYSKTPCPQGRFSINLLGTGFIVSPKTTWVMQGNHPTKKIQWLEGGQVIQGKCGGYCGNCSPDSSIGLLLDVAPP